MASDSIPGIYMDSTCFIDMAKHAVGSLGTGREDDIWHLKKLLEAHRAGEIEVFTSVLTIAECQHTNGHDQNVRDLFRRLLSSGQYVILVQPTVFIAEAARDLRWIHDITLKGPDSLHVASALHVGCGEFLTRDGGPKKEADRAKLLQLGLVVSSPHQTKLLPDRYRQEDIVEHIQLIEEEKDRPPALEAGD
ncbi:MAG: type II toxin-antitoxin system VapC family toxin [Gemmatimonadota bacterium]